MDAKTMVRNVAQTANVDESRAGEGIDVTLRVLAQRIYGDEARHLAAQLPVDFKESLAAAAGDPAGAERFGPDEFVQRVSEQLGVEPGQGRAIATAVLRVVGEAVEPGEWADVLAQLPSDMDPLFHGDKPSEHND